MDHDELRALLALERDRVAYDDDPATPEAGIVFLPGTRPVLLSAPHATRHRRAGRWKREEEYTAALVHRLHQRTGAHVLYASYRLDPDPHDDDDQGHYKQRVADLVRMHGVRLVLDVHGARGDRDFALALGTIYGQTCAPYEAAIVAAFEAVGFAVAGAASSLDRLALNPVHYAGGSSLPTVTRFVWQRLGVPAMQIEINSWARIVERLPGAYMAVQGIAPDFRGEPGRIVRVLDGLADAIGVVA